MREKEKSFTGMFLVPFKRTGSAVSNSSHNVLIFVSYSEFYSECLFRWPFGNDKNTINANYWQTHCCRHNNCCVLESLTSTKKVSFANLIPATFCLDVYFFRV